MVKIVADTTCSIPVAEAGRLGIEFLPQMIIFGDESYRDDHEIDTQTFLRKLRSSTVLPKTAAPPPALYNPIFQKAIDQGETVIVLCPTSELSGTYRSATVAAQDFTGADIRVVDTRVVAGGLGSLVLNAKQWADAGVDPDTIISRVQEMTQRNRTYFMVATLEYLYKGGRIGGAQALFGSILQVKPILMLKNGRIEPEETQRTKKRAITRLEELIRMDCENNPGHELCLMHGDALEDVQALAETMKQQLGIKEIPIYEVPPAIVVHAGPGVMAVSFFKCS
jgi:DegV family protein with EDD domain